MTKRNRRNNLRRGFQITEIFNYCLPFFIFSLTIFGNVFGLYFGLPFILSSWWSFLFHYILGNIESFLMLSSLYKCIVTSPGEVPRDWDQNLTLEEKEEILRLEPTVKDGKKRFCEQCGMFKPPRSHHSSMLGKCVYRMDHYCVWVSNVVGLHNQKYFILFLTYTWLSIAHFLVVSLYAFIVLVISFQKEENNPFLYIIFFINLIFVTFISPLGFVLTMFIFWTYYLLLTNTTSIEHGRNLKLKSKIQRYWRKVLRQKRYPKFYHIYNVNFMDNIKCVMGNDPWYWWSPFHGNEQDQDGIHFKVVHQQKLEDNEEILATLYDRKMTV